MGMWKGKTGRIQSLNQTKKFSIIKRVIVIFTVYIVIPCRYPAVSLTRLKHYLKHFKMEDFEFHPSKGKKSGILKFGIRNTAQEIRNLTNDWNPEFKFPLTKTGIQYMESGIHGVESRIQDCLGFPYMERVEFTCQGNFVNVNGRPRFPKNHDGRARARGVHLLLPVTDDV